MPGKNRPEEGFNTAGAENGSGTPTLPEMDASDEVQGYMIIPCSACMHQHRQTDPKCNTRCLHGSIYPGMPSNTLNAY